ncbi:MAG TPA: outer membrane protein assembly factor BamD [Geobacteraceae bacterium]|nr:outer membrane protein assembly factor BamD [Geobacteraceae bacterium]
MPFVRNILCSTAALILLAGCATTKSTATTPEAQFKEGERLYAGRHFEDAIAEWKKVKEGNASPELTAQADLKIADAQFENKNYIEAAAAYEAFRKLHPTNANSPYALYRLGLCYYNQITGIDTEQTPVKNAVTMFESFLAQYPASEFAPDARTKLEDCRAKQLRYEIYVGRFYLRTDHYQSAIKRFESALLEFPKSPNHDETLFYLGEAYLRTGDKKKGEEAFTRLFSEFPTSKYVAEARKLLKKY